MDKFYSLIKHWNDSNFSLPFSDFALYKSVLSKDNVECCEKLVSEKKLPKFEYCESILNFTKDTLYYPKGKNMVYVYRLPFFGNQITYTHGSEMKLNPSYRRVEISQTSQLDAEESALNELKIVYKFYIDFIRCWIIKDDVQDKDSFNILNHYSKNDGIISIPDFLVPTFKEASSLTSLCEKICIKEETLDSNSSFIKRKVKNKKKEIIEKFKPKMYCLNENIITSECPHCGHETILDNESEKMVECESCEKKYMTE